VLQLLKLYLLLFDHHIIYQLLFSLQFYFKLLQGSPQITDLSELGSYLITGNPGS
jgi:hypothetical protein